MCGMVGRSDAQLDQRWRDADDCSVGEVVNLAVRMYHDEDLFLYSAIACPGNSGGPIFGVDGHLVGLVTEELHEMPDENEKSSAQAAPWYAGLPAPVFDSALDDLGVGGLD